MSALTRRCSALTFETRSSWAFRRVGGQERSASQRGFYREDDSTIGLLDIASRACLIIGGGQFLQLVMPGNQAIFDGPLSTEVEGAIRIGLAQSLTLAQSLRL